MDFFHQYLKQIQTSGNRPSEVEESTQEGKPVVEKHSEVFTNGQVTVIESFQSLALISEIPKATNIKLVRKHEKKPKMVTCTASSLRRILRKQFFEVARPMAQECNLGDRSFNMSERSDV